MTFFLFLVLRFDRIVTAVVIVPAMSKLFGTCAVFGLISKQNILKKS